MPGPSINIGRVPARRSSRTGSAPAASPSIVIWTPGIPTIRIVTGWLGSTGGGRTGGLGAAGASGGGTGSGYDLSFTGDVLFSGSFASTGYKALASTSDLLEVVGVVAADGESVEVDEVCDLAVTDRGEAGQLSVVSGEWCGRSVSF